MSYGPVVPDGYGVCYNPRSHNIIVCITAFKANPDTQADYFANTLEGSLLQMQELCSKTKDNFDIITERLRNASLQNGSVKENGDIATTSKHNGSLGKANGQI